MNSKISFSIPEHFSTELLLHTFSFLNPGSLARSGCVCRQWRDVHEDESLWQLFSEKIGATSKKSSNSWKKHCINLLKRDMVREKWKSEKYVTRIVRRHAPIRYYAAIDGKHYEVRTNQKEKDNTLCIINVTDDKEIRTNFTIGSDCHTSLNGSLLTFCSKQGYLACLDITTGVLLHEALYQKLCICLNFSIKAQETNFIMILENKDRTKELVILERENDAKVIKLPKSSSLYFQCSLNFILVKIAENKFMRFNTSYEATDPLFVEKFTVRSNQLFVRYETLMALSEKYTAFASIDAINVYNNNNENYRQISLGRLINERKWNLTYRGDMIYDFHAKRPIRSDMEIIDDWLYLQIESQFFVFDLNTGNLVSNIDTIQNFIKCKPFDISFSTDGNILIFQIKPEKVDFSDRKKKHYLLIDYKPKKTISLMAKIQSSFQLAERWMESSAASLWNQASGL